MATVAPLRIDPVSVSAAAGETPAIELTVYNDSDLVEAYEIRLIGLHPTWVDLEPEPLRLLPATEGHITATVTLPAAFPAGDHEIGVLITALSTGCQVALEFVTVHVPPRMEATMVTAPTLVWAGKQARFTVLLHNLGNRPLPVVFQATDPEAAVNARFDPDGQTVEGGGRESTTLTASAKRPWFGSAVPRIITVTATGEGTTLDGLVTFMQKPRIPGWVLSLLPLLLLVAGGIAALVIVTQQTDDEPSAPTTTATPAEPASTVSPTG